MEKLYGWPHQFIFICIVIEYVSIGSNRNIVYTNILTKSLISIRPLASVLTRITLFSPSPKRVDHLCRE